MGVPARRTPRPCVKRVRFRPPGAGLPLRPLGAAGHGHWGHPERGFWAVSPGLVVARGAQRVRAAGRRPGKRFGVQSCGRGRGAGAHTAARWAESPVGASVFSSVKWGLQCLPPSPRPPKWHSPEELQPADGRPGPRLCWRVLGVAAVTLRRWRGRHKRGVLPQGFY